MHDISSRNTLFHTHFLSFNINFLIYLSVREFFKYFSIFQPQYNTHNSLIHSNFDTCLKVHLLDSSKNKTAAKSSILKKNLQN